MDVARKMGDFEAACQRSLTQGKGVEASRATKFLSKSSAHRLAAWRCVGISAHRLAGLAICEDFGRKMGDFEAAPQKTLSAGKGLEASRAKRSYLVIWLLGDSSLSCLVMYRDIGWIMA